MKQTECSTIKVNGLLDTFLSLVKIDSGSDPRSKKRPSTPGQLEVLKLLLGQLKKIAPDEISFDERYGYLYCKIKKNINRDVPSVGFIAHVDTSFQEPSVDVIPRVFTYRGGVINIDKKGKINLDPQHHTCLNDKIGKTIITASGKTLLGADDKAGCAEIIGALTLLRENPGIKHCDIYIAFTPDEEIGKSMASINTSIFKPDYAFTIDGEGYCLYEDENFNAVNGKVEFIGFNTHPGSAYKKMTNALRAGSKFISLLNNEHTPESTKNREGFIHFDSIKGDVNKVETEFIIRDFDSNNVEYFKGLLNQYKKQVINDFPGIKIEISCKHFYKNMKEVIIKNPHIEERISLAADRMNLNLQKMPVRGGTDGCHLSFMGIPTPNIFTGAYNFHSKYEFAVLEEMEVVSNLLFEIVKEFD